MFSASLLALAPASLLLLLFSQSCCNSFIDLGWASLRHMVLLQFLITDVHDVWLLEGHERRLLVNNPDLNTLNEIKTADHLINCNLKQNFICSIELLLATITHFSAIVNKR